MTQSQSDKANQFRAPARGAGRIRHRECRGWLLGTDDGRARVHALATSSGASAGMLGRRDGRVARDEALAQARVICGATDLPVSADLEKGFGDAPEIVAETIRLAAESGLVGCSIIGVALMP